MQVFHHKCHSPGSAVTEAAVNAGSRLLLTLFPPGCCAGNILVIQQLLAAIAATCAVCYLQVVAVPMLWPAFRM